MNVCGFSISHIFMMMNNTYSHDDEEELFIRY